MLPRDLLKCFSMFTKKVKAASSAHSANSVQFQDYCAYDQKVVIETGINTSS